MQHPKGNFRNIFGHDPSNQEVRERKTNNKANEWKTVEKNKKNRINLEKGKSSNWKVISGFASFIKITSQLTTREDINTSNIGNKNWKINMGDIERGKMC